LAARYVIAGAHERPLASLVGNAPVAVVTAVDLDLDDEQ
jgi:hypothetical protein